MIAKPTSFLNHLAKLGRLEIARSWSAKVTILITAGGAGLVTALTVILKLLIIHSPLSLLVGGALSAINFVGSFLFMQVLGFRLATKQSPLLGAALGERWKALARREVGLSVTTQLFSAFGNLALVLPSAFFFHWVFSGAEQPFLEPETARAALASLHPLKSGTLAYAALTGVLLWASSHFGGWIAHRLRPFSKTATTALFNIFLGALLAVIPTIGYWLRIPLDVRHFTLSGGTVAVAVGSLGLHKAWEAGLAAALVGVIAIGFLNFSVSFTLAFVSVRRAARQVD